MTDIPFELKVAIRLAETKSHEELSHILQSSEDILEKRAAEIIINRRNNFQK